MIASCPELVEVDATKPFTMGDLLRKTVEIAGTYNECRAAALGTNK